MAFVKQIFKTNKNAIKVPQNKITEFLWNISLFATPRFFSTYFTKNKINTNTFFLFLFN